MKKKIIALYLPQYHPTPDNNEWWGKGFTEWTNVAKAKNLFSSHYQPKVPTELGFYDLRLPIVRQQQADMAKEAGVSAFCYYHYWFGNGKQELELPFNEVVKTGEPDFPFCLCWANEPWYSKMWNVDGTIGKKLLVDQVYPGEKDNEEHFYSLLNAFKDPRYLKIRGKLVFMIYKPMIFASIGDFMSQWNDLAIKNGLPGFYFIGHCQNPKSQNDVDEMKKLGFDAINVLWLSNFKASDSSNVFEKLWNYLSHRVLKRPYINDYKNILPRLIGNEAKLSYVYPSIVPNWDHTPRSGGGGYLYQNCAPELFYEHIKTVFESIDHKDSEDQVVFLKSWNEWGEGNYMEPDLKYGRGYIDALRKAIDE